MTNDKQSKEKRDSRLKKALRANLARRKSAGSGPANGNAMKRRETSLRKADTEKPVEKDS